MRLKLWCKSRSQLGALKAAPLLVSFAVLVFGCKTLDKNVSDLNSGNISVSLCDVAEDPAYFVGRSLLISGIAEGNGEYFIFFDKSCPTSIFAVEFSASAASSSLAQRLSEDRKATHAFSPLQYNMIVSGKLKMPGNRGKLIYVEHLEELDKLH